jgi:hypothetical protein
LLLTPEPNAKAEIPVAWLNVPIAVALPCAALLNVPMDTERDPVAEAWPPTATESTAAEAKLPNAEAPAAALVKAPTAVPS